MQEETKLDPNLEKKLKGHKDYITALYFHPTENQLSSSSLDCSVMIWNIWAPVRSYRFLGHTEAVMDVTFSCNGKLLASVSRDKTVRLWVPNVTGSTGQFKAHTQTIRSVQFTSDVAKIITGSDDKTVKLWSVSRQKFISSYVGHTNWVKCARLSNDDSIIASCSDDKTTKLWSIDSGECIYTYNETKGSCTHVAWHPAGCYVAVALSNGTVKLYDTRMHSLVQHYRIHDNIVNQIHFHPSGNYMLTCSKDNKMKVLDLMEGHPIYTLMGHTGAISAVTFSCDGEYFASAGEDKEIFIWKTNFAREKDESKENLEENLNPITQPSGSKTNVQGLKKTQYRKGIFMQLRQLREDVVESFKDDEVYGVREFEDYESAEESPDLNIGEQSHIPREPLVQKEYLIPNLQTLETQNGNTTNNHLMNSSLPGRFILGNSRQNKRHNTDNYLTSTPIKIPDVKKMRTDTLHKGSDICACVDMLPTVNAIVEHLNVLHDALDVVDHRLGSVEASFR